MAEYLSEVDIQTYYMRARDTGTAGWVYWLTVSPFATPTSIMTMPNYTGVLSSTMVVYNYRTSIDAANGFITITGGTPDTFGNGWARAPIVVALNFIPAFNISTDILVFSGSAVRVV